MVSYMKKICLFERNVEQKRTVSWIVVALIRRGSRYSEPQVGVRVPCVHFYCVASVYASFVYMSSLIYNCLRIPRP